MTTVTLAVAAVPARQARLDAWIEALGATDPHAMAVVVEGWAVDLQVPSGARIVRVAGCPCCIGQTALRVALLRLLRADKPAQLLLLLGPDAQIEHVRDMLSTSFAGHVRLVPSA